MLESSYYYSKDTDEFKSTKVDEILTNHPGQKADKCYLYPILQKVKLRLKRRSDFPGKVSCLSLKYPFSKLPAYDVCVNKTLCLILKQGVMPFIVFNAAFYLASCSF